MNNRGFTLLELVVIVALMVVMASLAIPATSSWRQNAQYRQAAREAVSILRRARSIAVRQNQNTTVTVDLSNREYLLAGEETAFPKNVKIESKIAAGDVWKDNGSFSIIFRPQGTSSGTLFVRINGDDNLQVRVDSMATGLAHM